MDGEPGRRERKKAETRRALHDAAMAQFAAKGFNATRVSDVTDAVDVSERTFFRYFESKEDVASSALRAWIESLFAAIESIPSDVAPDAAVARVLADARGGRFPFGEAELRDVVLYAAVPEVQQHLARVIDGVRLRLIDDFARRCGSTVADAYPRLLASIVTAGLFAIMESWLLGGQRDDAWDTAGRMIHQVAGEFAAIVATPRR